MRLLTLALCSFSLMRVLAGDWTRFRGPNGSGVADSTGLPVEFGPGNREAWRTELPFGASSPVIAGNRLWLTSREGDKLITLCLDAPTGKILWRRQIDRPRRERHHKLNDPASPSPVTDGSNVYVFFPDFGMVSYGPDGNERWRHSLGPFQNMFGMAASPMLAGNRLVLVCDQQKGSFMIALDKDSGKQSWRVDRAGTGIGWAVPILRDEEELIVFSNRRVEGVSLSDGSSRWWHNLVLDASNGVPLLDGDTLYVNAPGYDQPWVPTFASMLEKVDLNQDKMITAAELAKEPDLAEFFDYLDDNGDGKVDAKEWEISRQAGVGEYGLTALKLGPRNELSRESVAWRLKRNLPYVPAPILYQGVLYMVKGGGIITTVDPKTGAILKQGRSAKAPGEYYASPVAADGKVYMVSLEGKLTVLKADAQWEVLAVNDMLEECYATPAIANGRIYVRTRTALYGFQTGATGK